MRGSRREPHHEIGLLALQPAHCPLSRWSAAAGQYLPQTEAEDFRFYHPELHYMRGPGPKWREKHALAVSVLSVPRYR